MPETRFAIVVHHDEVRREVLSVIHHTEAEAESTARAWREGFSLIKTKVVRLEIPTDDEPAPVVAEAVATAPKRTSKRKTAPAAMCPEHWKVWGKCFNSKYHQWPAFEAPDLRASKALGMKYNTEQLHGLFKAFLTDDAPFLTGKFHPLRFLGTGINRYLSDARIKVEPDLTSSLEKDPEDLLAEVEADVPFEPAEASQ